jgi:hypothetical protein
VGVPGENLHKLVTCTRCTIVTMVGVCDTDWFRCVTGRFKPVDTSASCVLNMCACCSTWVIVHA